MLLAEHFLVHFASQLGRGVQGISEAAANCLIAYPWPGNVRELRNCIERAVALTRFDHLVAEDLPERIRTHAPNHVVVAGDVLEELVPLEVVERRYSLRVLQVAGGNKSLAARSGWESAGVPSTGSSGSTAWSDTVKRLNWRTLARVESGTGQHVGLEMPAQSATRRSRLRP